ncbi:MAG TPA: GEVED domain-containing protein [Thermoanaerobaculia bacterium]|nr:GEVED domain-containing protein [Thermoanaerobaculia bacterium]
MTGSLFVLCLLAVSAAAQPLVKSAIQVDPGNTKEIGALFAYRLTYNCSSTSGPCLNAQVVDLLPAEVTFDSTVPASPTLDVAAINVTNNFMGSGRTRVQFVMTTPLPAGNSGDLMINVRFPIGSTPDGTVATNTADGINLGASPGTMTTPPVNVTAVGTVQVNLTKTLQTSPANLDMPETYRLRVSVPNNDGALRLNNIGPVVDTLPIGTVFNGATPAADCQPGCVGTTPPTVTWTSPCSVPLNPGQNCDIFVNVVFPSGTFPSGTNVTNEFTANATPLGEPPQTFGPGTLTHPVTTFVPNADASLGKSLTDSSPNPPTLNQTFTYQLNPSNSGNVPLDNMVVTDTVPVELQIASVTTGAYNNLADFAPGVGVRVSYEKNTALGVFTLWGSSPNTTTSTTLPAPPPGLGAGEYITRIRWQYGQAQVGMNASTRPLITGQIINPDHLGGPVAFGDTISNCVTLTSVYTAGPANANENVCRDFVLSGPFVQLNPAKDNLSGSGPFNTGQTVSWRLRVRSAAQSSDPVPLEHLVVSDLLPIDLTFTSWTFDDQSTGLPAPQNFSQIPNFAGTGRTLLRWTWNAASGSLGVNQQVWINISTTVRNGAMAGPLSNDMLIDSDAPGLGLRCSNNSQADPFDVDGDGNTAETLCRAAGSINVAPIAQLVSSKTIQGNCDGGAVSISAGTLTGGGIEYHLRVQNLGTVPMQNLVIIDILPFVGDTGVRDTNPRGSQWSPLLGAPIVPPSGTTLYYSTSGNPCRGEVGGPTTGCDPANWTTSAPTPISSVRSFKLEFGDRVVTPYDFAEFTFVMTTPGDVPPAAVAYNSFAYQADRGDGLGSLAAEPVKVGISIGSCDAASLGDFVWVDTNDDGIQNDGSTGMNGVFVQLFQPGPDNFPGTPDDVPIASTITANSPLGAPGWYLFPGLAPASYFVRITPPANFDIAQRDTTSDGNDSDSDPQGVSHVVTLASNEENLTVDFGLIATAFGAAGNYVWFDRDSDGIQNEPVTSGINGVTVHLYLDDGDGNAEPGGDDLLSATTVTADDIYTRPGYYLFEGLVPGLPYFIQFITPASATATTTSNAGGDDTVDSDPAANGTTPIFSVAALELNPTFDAGYIAPGGTLSLGDQVWRDTDNDGIYEPQNGELGIDDVRLDLYRDVNSDGEPSLDEFADSSVTATNSGFAGRYLFTDLAPGNYIVVVAPQNFDGGSALSGLSTSTGNDPAPDPDDDANGDDNGTNIGSLIASRPVTLSDNGEPTSEDGNNDSNLTVDFGFIAGGDPPDYDYGDAPDVGVGSAPQNYQTTALDVGPRHLLGVAGAPYLGVCVDGDSGFAQNIAASADDVTAGSVIGACGGGDDENGVTFTGSFTPGGTANFVVTSGGPVPCLLDAWVDWNQNGVFDGSELFASAQSIPIGPATNVGTPVPSNAIPGRTYARFRCSTAGNLSPYGVASDGEVEDYAITIIGSDFGDAPSSYGTAEHLIDPLTPLHLGGCVDTEVASQPSTNAVDDDANPGTSSVGSCFDDENGVTLLTPLATCTTSNVNVISSAPAFLDAWIDFNNDGDFGDAGEHVFASTAVIAGTNALTISVPCNASPGAVRYGRFRLSTTGGLTPTGTTPNGEVEDYAFAIAGTDFGDAPDSYHTLLASDGARHIIVDGFSLGATVDPEPDGQPNAAANGDGADEDGVTLPTVDACATMNYTVALTNTAGITTPLLDAWIDFDGDGAFNNPRDRIATAVALTPGANALTAAIPCNIRTRSSYARFRLTDGGINVPDTGTTEGEIEDYVVTIQAYDYGDAADPTYPTLLASNGARHLVLLTNNPTLGATTDTEDDGAPNAAANGDDTTGIDDEDGVVISTLVAATTGSITVTSGATGGNVSCWIDFNNDGDWTDSGEQIVTNLGIGASGSLSPTFPVPADSTRGTLALRCRMSSLTGLTPVGPAANGEIEDHLVTVTGYDLGDAPAPYPTLLANSGARHQLLVANNPTLGATVDSDTDGQPSAGFNGDDTALVDDEDGVTFPTTLLPSTNGSITVTAGTTGGVVSCWLDFNRDGDWADTGEQVATDLVLAGGGNASPTFAVPADAPLGITGLRCRIATLGGLTPTGDAADGEIEDHAVLLGSVDLGDAPDTYGTTLTADGPRHGIVTGFTLGATVDSEAEGQPSVGANGDGADEDGVTLPASLTACNAANVTVTLTNTAGIGTPLLDAWIDFGGDGVFAPGDRIATSLALVAGVNNVPVNVPCGAATSASYARFRLSSTGTATPLSAVNDGEIEDYAILIQGLDFGDAADPTFPTLLTSNGARHIVLLTNNPTLGATVDTEADGVPTAGANGDDSTGSDDENGVTFDPLIPGADTNVTITTGATGGIVNLWIDFTGDGDWSDAGEQVVTEQLLGAGASQAFPFTVPVGTTPGSVTVRARISSQAGLGVTSQANDGEIEDHVVLILAAEPRIGVAMELETLTPAGGCGVFDLTFAILLQNLGNVTLNNVQAVTPLASVFVPPASYSVTSISSVELPVNPAYDGNAQQNLLLPGATLAAGASGTIRFVVRLDATCQNITYTLSTTASGEAPDNTVVTDVSQNGDDTDTDNDGDAEDNNDPTVVEIQALSGIPTLDTWALIAISLMLAAVALKRMT